MRKTKIICTIGPSCENEETLKKMCLAGMNTARLNFSHGSHEEHQKKIDLIKKVREELDMPIAIMLDTKGPEFRIKTFKDDKVVLAEGQEFTLTTEDIEGDESRVSVNYKNLTRDLTLGDRVLINNGLIILEVMELSDTEARCKVITGGELSNRKSMNFPNKVMSGDYLSEQDKADILFGIKNDVDFVAASFVSTKEDMLSLRSFMDENGGEAIDIIAKIENRSGIDNMTEICEVANGIMVARGDLGVEIPYVEVPSVQKHLINECRLLGSMVVTATEMLESMIYNPRPTRAEISDVANAVYDGTSAIMLSGETAAGKYPVEAVETMAAIAEQTENDINYQKRFYNRSYEIRSTLDAISHTIANMSIDVDAKAIVVNSISGKTARFVGRFRGPVGIIGMTSDEKVWRKLNLSWGVTPVLTSYLESKEEIFKEAKRYAKEVFNLQKGDYVVITGGNPKGRTGNTDTIKLDMIED